MALSTISDKATPISGPSRTSIGNRLLDHFVPTNQIHDSNNLYRARILVGVIISYICLMLIAGLIFGLFTSVSLDSKLLTYGILFIPAVIFCLLLVFYKRTGLHGLCANAAIAIAYLLIFFGITIAGGPFYSPANYMLPVPPLFAFCVAGISSGIQWSVIVLTTFCIFVFVSFSGFIFPRIIDYDNIKLNEAIDCIVAYCAIVAIAIIYERMNLMLRSERDAERQRLHFMAHHDVLTGLANRVLFHDRLDGAVLRTLRHKQKCALLYLDLDGFKPINDTYGHHVGDSVLKTVADRLQDVIRGNDTVARIGGDEFGIILEDLTQLSDINNIINKLHRCVSASMDINGNYLSIGASIGAVICPRDGTKADELVKKADQAMYEVKLLKKSS